MGNVNLSSSLSRKFVELVLIFGVEEPEFPHNCAKSYLKTWARFLSTVTTAVNSLKSEEDWSVDFFYAVKPRIWQCLQPGFKTMCH